MKKTIMLVLLGGLVLTGCGGPQAAEPVSSASAVAVVEEGVTVPNVVGLTLDKASDQLKELGLEVEHEDIVDGKSIWSKKNWLVMSQDAAKGAQLTKESTVKLGVKSLEKIAEEKAAAEKAAAAKAAAEKAAADKAAAAKAAATKAAAEKAAAQKAAADQAAREEAARLAAEQAAPPAPPAVPVAPAPAAVAPAPAAAVVTPGAFCSPSGATGVSAKGTAYTCKPSATDSRSRWRQ
ncbi:PASTA domain-containing protein [Pseudarthrobacter sp. NPDC092424]|uniref:PASTA domain-containing protein n=1 Tax=Pseudarthrobacter sp. NPDC092424 TaxID=3364415 RepID=UPI0038140765